MRFENIWGCLWSLQTHWAQNMLQFWKNWILPQKASFLLVFSYSEPYARWDLNYGGRFTSAIKSGAVPQVSESFSEMPKVIMKHILEPSNNWNSPREFASQWMSCTVQNFYIKIAVKSSPSARFLTKNLFFTFDFRMINIFYRRQESNLISWDKIYYSDWLIENVLRYMLLVILPKKQIFHL